MQNKAVAAAALAGANESRAITDPLCASSACYPAAVNYAPTYMLINGQSFDVPIRRCFRDQCAGGGVDRKYRDAVRQRRFADPHSDGSGIADGADRRGRQPGHGASKIQTEVLLTAGKTYDVVVRPATNAPRRRLRPLQQRHLPGLRPSVGNSINNKPTVECRPTWSSERVLPIGVLARRCRWLAAAVKDDSFTLPISATTSRPTCSPTT